jgi:hypothetical protein
VRSIVFRLFQGFLMKPSPRAGFGLIFTYLQLSPADLLANVGKVAHPQLRLREFFRV